MSSLTLALFGVAVICGMCALILHDGTMIDILSYAVAMVSLLAIVLIVMFY